MNWSAFMHEEVQCGIDEAGRGPVIGPMVISIVCCKEEYLREIGVKDSKMLSRKRREYLFDKITKNCAYSYVVVSPETLNKDMASESLNKIEENYILELLSKAEGIVYIDCFDVIEERAEKYIREKSGKEVVCKHKADSIYPAVSAASIVSKVIRDREIDKIAEKYGFFGSGYPSDPRTIDFLRKAMQQGLDLRSVARIHWETYKKIKEDVESGQKKLF
ncbi:ribonuclease HII [Thermoplasma volcanium GSS1]|nr:ribonuclease HII [Thermoplasma volcanium GSS1]